MSRNIRSATLQMRVTPEVKRAGEHVLRRLGLTMTEAVELFLRRVIVEERIPFEVVAIDNATFTNLLLDWEEEQRTKTIELTGRRDRGHRTAQTRRKGRSTR